MTSSARSTRSNRTRRHAAAAIVCTFAFAASSAFTLLPTRASAQHPAAGATHRAVTIAGPAPGISGSILQQALNGPHHEWIVAPGETGLVPRDTSFDATLVIVGGSARVQAKVKGDVIVTGGDLILGVGVRIEGRAIAIGGIVYHSPWAYVRDSTYTYTVHRYDLERRSGAPALVYRRQRESEGRAPFELPGYYGIREITYDRVQGVGISYGPDLVIPFADARINLAAAWHSSLGAFDPSVHLRIPFATAAALDLDARRETHSNELWIESNLDNTFSTLVSGADARNYYRAKRVEGLVSRPIEFLRGRLEVEAGARWEDASSAFTTTPVLWSVFLQYVERGMERRNPPILPGEISSALVGAKLEYDQGGVATRLQLRAEVPWQGVGERYQQMVLDGSLFLPTVGAQYYRAHMHAVVTTGGPAPAQRFHYLGGPLTISTLALMSLGGDELLHLEQLYTFPLTGIDDPLIGTPKLSVRHVLAAADVGRLGVVYHNVGLRLDVGVVRVDFVMDPVGKGTYLSFSAAIGP